MASRFRFQPKRATGTNATIGLIIAISICFFVSWLTIPSQAIFQTFAFHLDLGKFWQLLTYPFAMGTNGESFVSLVFSMIWLNFFGGILERRFGWKVIIGTFFVASVVGGLLAFLASNFFPNTHLLMSGSYYPVSVITILACALQPEEVLRLLFITVKFKWIALFSGLSILFLYGAGAPFAGILLALPMLFSWFYGLNKIPIITQGQNIFTAKAEKKKSNREFDEFRSKVRDKEQERQERERLRKLFEGSFNDQDPPQAEK